jgi:hypothetical protein
MLGRGDSLFMYLEPKRIKVEPGSELARLLEDVNETPLLLEVHGVLYHVTASGKEADIWADYDPERVRAGLKESAGALSGVDTKQLLADIRASREQRRSGHRSS